MACSAPGPGRAPGATLLGLHGLLALSLACGSAPGAERLVVVDGSSTVYPMAEALAEDFQEARPEYRVIVGVSGTGGGFQRFCAGETDISNASRDMTPEERARCEAAGVIPLRLPLALDGITLVAHPDNDVVECLTLAELRRIWEPGSEIRTWHDVRPGFPVRDLHLYGPGPDSGTFDFFTTVVVGRPRASRVDYYQTEDDFLIARGVSGDRWAVGYFGHSYFVGSDEMLKAVAVDLGFGCVSPSPATIADGRYGPLTRELFAFVDRVALDRRAVRDFAQAALANAPRVAREVGYVALPEGEYARSRERLLAAVGHRVEQGGMERPRP